jgi:hypothetical protein
MVACTMLAQFTQLGLTPRLMSEARELDSETIGHEVAASMCVSVAGTLIAAIAA